MPTARHSAISRTPAAALWARLADLDSWPRWLRAPYADQSVTLTAAPSAHQGAEFVMKGRLPYRLFARITDWQPERGIEFEIHRSEYPSDRFTFGRARIAIRLERLPDGRTRVTCEHRLCGRGLLGRLYGATVMRPFLKSNVRRIVGGLIGSE